MNDHRPARRWAGTLALLLIVNAASCSPRPTVPVLTLATTTSVANSGLLDVLLARFQDQRGIRVRAHLAGSGLALRMLENGNADVVVSHAPDAEASALKRRPAWRYRKIMFNDFVLVGPLTDPAHVRGAPDVETAMRRIAGSDTRFLSRGDQSGTHEREQQLWRLADAHPASDRLVVAGAGMGATLRIASETDAYTLTDRATLAQHAGSVRLVIVFEGGPHLLNTYAAIVDPSGPRARDADVFLDWLSDGGGRQVIEAYRIRDVPAFLVWPEGVGRDDPFATPH